MERQLLRSVLPLVTVRLVVKAQVERMDRCLPQHEEKTSLHEKHFRNDLTFTHMDMQTIVPSWFDVINSFSFQKPNTYQYRFWTSEKKEQLGLFPLIFVRLSGPCEYIKVPCSILSAPFSP